jgi:hypothetical protein
MRFMIASRNAGSAVRNSSLIRNCKSRKRELTLLSSIVNVPDVVSQEVTEYPVMLDIVKIVASGFFFTKQGIINTIRSELT